MSLDHLNDISTQNYVSFASISILIYDHILTFPAEVSHIWPQPLSSHTVLFFLNRYVGLVSNTGASALIFFSTATTESCKSVSRVHEILVVLSQFIISGILLSRIFALYHISRSIRSWAFSLGVVLVVGISWALVGQKRILIHGAPGCHFSIPQKQRRSHTPLNSAVHLATAWEAQALFDAVVLTLTVMRTVKMRKTINTAIGPKGTGLLDILIRDGTLYFAIMSLAVSQTFWFSTISVTMCSRLVLNLYEAATPDNTISSSSPDPATTCVLTTRIELGISADNHSDEELEGIPS
ncbi:hypothetical protein BGW80DRAFT_1445111 [Lactifluus volemus]|nr:hypothetical protein BGW80DRAFT_1445111 [Lactifluus volemus]